MIVPTVHSNGTAGAELLDQLCDAGAAVQAAMEAHAKAAPNGRDYYPQGPQALPAAIEAWATRQAALDLVYRELATLAEAVADL